MQIQELWNHAYFVGILPDKAIEQKNIDRVELVCTLSRQLKKASHIRRVTTPKLCSKKVQVQLQHK